MAKNPKSNNSQRDLLRGAYPRKADPCKNYKVIKRANLKETGLWRREIAEFYDFAYGMEGQAG